MSLNDLFDEQRRRLGLEDPPPAPPPPSARKLRVVEDEADKDRAHAWLAAKADAHIADMAAMDSNSGRNAALNFFGYTMGKFVPKWISEEDVIDLALVAAAANGVLAEDGRKTCENSVRSGLAKGQTERRDPPISDDTEVDDWLSSLPDYTAKQATEDNPGTGKADDTGKADNADEPDPDADRAEAEARLHARQVLIELRRVRAADAAKTAYAAEKAARTFREPPSTFTLADELNIPDEPVTYAIEELLPTGANALLAAQFKAGKTTLINNYARSFADGTPFLGKFHVTPSDGRIAIYNYEVGRDQYRRWLREMHIDNPDRIVVLNLRGFRLPLTSPTVEDWVVRWLAARNVTAWVVDPFARASTADIQNENDNSQVGVWLDTLDVIKERAGIRDLILPTHTGRAEHEAGKEHARGATRLDDWADVRWLLTKDDEGNSYFRATGRDVSVAEELLTYSDTDRGLTFGGGDRKWVKDRRQLRKVLDYLTTNPGRGTREVEVGIGTKNGTSALLAQLVSGGYLRVETEGKKSAHYPTGKSL